MSGVRQVGRGGGGGGGGFGGGGGGFGGGRRRRDWRRTATVAGAIAVLAAMMLAMVSGALVDDGGDADVASEQTTTTTVPLNEAGRELLALLEKDRGATFHARYTASSAEQPNASIEIETWRKPPKVRQDSVITSGGQKVHTSAFVLDGQSIRCARLGEAAWSCQTAAAGVDDDLLFGGVREQLGKGTVTAKDDVIDGRPVRCFTLTVPSENKASELCATAAGIPVRVQSGGSGLRLVGFDEAVNDEVFVPPASPSPAP